MRPGRVGSLFGTVVLGAAGLYFFVYLWRWEWNRATIAGLIFVAAEVALATAVVLSRLRRLDERLERLDERLDRAPDTREPDAGALATLRQSAPPPHDHFEWLSPRNGHTGVFVPVLLGMGVVASALAWLVERVARATARPVLEKGLAARLGSLSWPAGGLVGPDHDPLALLTGPAPQVRWRRA